MLLYWSEEEGIVTKEKLTTLINQLSMIHKNEGDLNLDIIIGNLSVRDGKP